MFPNVRGLHGNNQRVIELKLLTVGTDTSKVNNPKVRSSKFPKIFLRDDLGSPVAKNRRQFRNPPLNNRRPVDENILPGRGTKV